jgi:dienelactone hydrolase
LNLFPACRTGLTASALLCAAAVATAQPSGRDVDVPASDGVLLRATYYSAGAPGPAVLLLHMCNSTRKAWSTVGEKLAARGIHALALDYRGYGDSGGQRREDLQEQQAMMNAMWPRDMDSALAFLVARPGVDRERVGVAGASCGVHQAVQLARRQREVKALALLAGDTDWSGEEFLATTPGLPLLGAAAADDGTVVEDMKWLLGFSAFPGNRLIEFARGGHGTELFAAHPDLETILVDWFEEHLVKHPASLVPSSTAPPAGPSAALFASLRGEGGAARMREALRGARAKGEPFPLPPEGVVNALGYENLQGGKPKEAIELFLLNTEARPRSANACDSLADAYLADGQTARAAEFAEKALNALAGDPNQGELYQKVVRESAEAKLKQLRKEP